MPVRLCKSDGCKDKTGNCLFLGSDNLPVQCVGSWAEDKYFFLEKYLNASCEARRMFSDKGNAVFIDLFSGPGKCIIKHTQKEIDSGGMRALQREKAPFNEYYYFDISKTDKEALEKRTTGKTGVYIEEGDSNILINKLVSFLLKKPYRYHFAFVDPFGPDGLKFETLRSLAKLSRMDMLIHFPIGAIKRNLKNWIKSKDTILDNFLGTEIWRQELKNTSQGTIFRILIDIFKKQLESVGYPEEGLKMAASGNNIYSGLPAVSIKNTKEVDLYVLILASKHKLAQKIWNSVIKASPDGQKNLF